MRLALPCILAALPLLLGSAAMAEDGMLEGVYVGSGEGELRAEFTHIENDAYAVSLSTMVPMQKDGFPGCGGAIEGEAILSETGGNFFVENEDYVQLSDNPMLNELHCEIALTWKDGILVMEEKSGCLQYHGAACSFTGQLVIESAAG